MSNVDSIRASYDRCVAAGDFAAVFYEHFFQQSPEIPPYFAKTDWVAQKRHLRASLLTLIKYPADPATVHTLQHIGQTHCRMQRNIRPDLYPFFKAALVEALAASDPEWSPALEQAWIQRVEPGIAVVISLYDSPTAA